MSKRILNIMIFTLLLILSGCGLFSSPGKTTKNFYRAVEAGKLDQATKMVSSKVKSGMGDQKMRTMLSEATRKIREHRGIDSIEITSEQVTGDVADVSGTIKYSDGTSENFNQKLLKEDGDWKLE
jgi:hypothetical protein